MLFGFQILKKISLNKASKHKSSGKQNGFVDGNCCSRIDYCVFCFWFIERDREEGLIFFYELY